MMVALGRFHRTLVFIGPASLPRGNPWVPLDLRPHRRHRMISVGSFVAWSGVHLWPSGTHSSDLSPTTFGRYNYAASAISPIPPTTDMEVLSVKWQASSPSLLTGLLWRCGRRRGARRLRQSDIRGLATPGRFCVAGLRLSRNGRRFGGLPIVGPRVPAASAPAPSSPRAAAGGGQSATAAAQRKQASSRAAATTATLPGLPRLRRLRCSR
jgi:hypothetical protein